MKITYSITKWDVYFATLRISWKNRVIRVVILLLLSFVGWSSFKNPGIADRSIELRVISALVAATVFGCIFVLGSCILQAAMVAARKYQGVCGVHTLEIADVGLIEKTEFNETVSKWRGFRATEITGRYIYVRPTDTTYYQIPKRDLSKSDVEQFVQGVGVRLRNG
jgi:hypothetical protein